MTTVWAHADVLNSSAVSSWHVVKSLMSFHYNMYGLKIILINEDKFERFK